MSDALTSLTITIDIILNLFSFLVLYQIRHLGLVGRNRTITLFTLSIVSGFLLIVLAAFNLNPVLILLPFLFSDLFLLLGLYSLYRSLRSVFHK